MNQFDALSEVVRRVEAGEAVFFIGAGFSVDSEGNTAARLMRRLLVRFQAFTNCLADRLLEDDPRKIEVALLPPALRDTFQLTPKIAEKLPAEFPWLIDDEWEDGKCIQRSDVTLLSSKYFEANDWFCGTFQRLLQIAHDHISDRADPSLDRFVDFGNCPVLLRSDEARDFIEALNDLENDLLAKAGKSPDPVAFQPMDARLLVWSKETIAAGNQRNQNAGKALFLDTMGFDEPAIMGGQWLAHQSLVSNTYQDKLLPRYHVLARLAREGLAPTVLTTNYDMLLEGAWRSVGFCAEAEDMTALVQPDLMPPVLIDDMAKIGKATEFFRYGRGNTTANVVKVHGCTDIYRTARAKGSFDMFEWLSDPTTAPDSVSWDDWRQYLPSMVFTYREIQNWRDDSWARDYLATVQRTRTVIFCGYSLQDPVLHDAFRSVYEDMSRQRIRTDRDNGNSTAFSHAPAFFWNQAGKNSFYASEVLDAASAATGAHRWERDNHPNMLDYRFRGAKANCFPDLDDGFLLLYHKQFRNQQSKCIQTDLIQVLSALLGRLVLKKEVEEFKCNWREILDAEERFFRGAFDPVIEASETDWGIESRRLQRQFRDTVNWTYHFGANMVRELASIELLQRNAGHSVELSHIRSPGWYLPARSNRPASAWGTVVEVALRRVFGNPFEKPAVKLVEAPTEPEENLGEVAAAGSHISPYDAGNCVPAESIWPAVYFRELGPNGKLLPDPICLQIVAGGSQMHASAGASMLSHLVVEWNLGRERFPWPVEPSKTEETIVKSGSNALHIVSPLPASELWRWATSGTAADAQSFFLNLRTTPKKNR